MHVSCTVLQACSEYHYLLLYADKLVAINQVSGKVAAEVNWGPGSHTPSISGKTSHYLPRLLSGAVWCAACDVWKTSEVWLSRRLHTACHIASLPGLAVHLSLSPVLLPACVLCCAVVCDVWVSCRHPAGSDAGQQQWRHAVVEWGRLA